MTKNKLVSLLCPTAFLIFGIWVRISAASMTKRDAMLPILVSYAVIVISIVDFVVEYRKENHKNRFADVNYVRILECLASMFLYVFLIKKIGFFFDTLLLTAFTMWALDYKNYKMLAAASLIITTAVFVVFKILLRVPLPTLWL